MPSVAINFSYTWDGASIDTATSIFSKFQAFGGIHAPSELGITCTIKPGSQIQVSRICTCLTTSSDSGTCQISGVYYGSMDNLHNTMVTFVQSFPAGFTRVVNRYTWLQSLQALAGNQALNTSGYSDYVRL